MYSGLLTSTPPTRSTFDLLLNWYLFFGVGAAVVVISLLAYFMIRYRAREGQGPMPEHKTEGWKIVLVTALITISILTVAEYQTFASFGNIEVPTQATCLADTGLPCVQVCLVAFQWGWNFTYARGNMSCDQAIHRGLYSGKTGNLTVPMGRDIIINITTRDVFHSFGIDFLAIKEDAIPKVNPITGQPIWNQVWFEIPSLKVPSGDVAAVCTANSCTYVNAIKCFELCGVGHATMWGNLTVVQQSTWTSWTGGP